MHLCAKGWVQMPTEEDRRLAHEAVSRGLLSPGQANEALKWVKQSESSGRPVAFRDVLLHRKTLSPKRWQEFEKALKDADAKSAPSPLTPPPAVPVASAQELSLPFTMGEYRLIEKLGQGGMGAVYKAIQIQLRRHVAIKILAPKLAADPDFVERLRHEARAAAALNHPNVVVPIDVGEHAGIHYLAMEYIEGETLSKWMEREGRLPWRAAVEVALQVARGLEHAHKLGLVHRDIKPDNILLDRPSRLAKIADLGLAQRAGESHAFKTGHDAVGTPYYISPEQARGAADLDGRADIYSLGATLWHILVGVPPFDGPSGAVIMAKHLTEPVPDPRTSVTRCPEEVVAVINKMMAKHPPDRYATCGELAQDLECLLSDAPLCYARTSRRGGRHHGALPSAAVQDGPGRSRLRDPLTSRSALGEVAR